MNNTIRAKDSVLKKTQYSVQTFSILPNRPPRFKVGDLVDIQRKNGEWMTGKVVLQEEYQVTVHFEQDGLIYSKIMQDYSRKIAPAGHYS
jgi:hypothetical protein